MPSRLLVAGALTLGLSAGPSLAEPPRVVASIKPIHSLVAAVMQGVAEPELLLDGAVSPHTYAMRPSDAGKLAEADMVVWAGAGVESFLGRALATLAPGAEIVEAGSLKGLKRLAYREGGLFEPHDHAEDGHGHDDMPDAHVWLDPANAQVIVAALGERLAAADPGNAEAYRENAGAMHARLGALDGEIAERMAPVAGRRFLVFHDAFQYFEEAYGLQATGSVVVSPEIAPGARRVAELQARITETGTRCLVAEPQFPREMVDMLAADGTRIAVLDPNGAAIEAGPLQYEEMMRANAAALAACLADPAR
ncbi:zinc ABC transporter substrate-binding protein [Aureimonas populi]|uniref:High-affinity zinc uptake system protein ZnuA n=1 Tax=Aureimonas populi TaxID=1701758 RepID=A0ABW5CHY9_9HYPH|nr:zinc ABC transporter substrate-binding protein [Aureimonas populi]